MQTVGKSTAYVLVDTAKSGLDRVVIRVVGCQPEALTGHLVLDDDTAKFAVVRSEPENLRLPPSITVSWMGHEDVQTWTSELP